MGNMQAFGEPKSFDIMFTTHDFPVEDLVSFMSRVCQIYGVVSCKLARDRVTMPVFTVSIASDEVDRIKAELLGIAEECIGHGIVKCR